MSISKSSKRWMQRHVNDPYVKLSQKEGYRSRAVYKLLEINEKDKLLKPGMTVIDLGAAPGSWSQVLRHQIGGKGKIIALDILPMDSIPDVTFIQGDFQEQQVFDQLLETVNSCTVDLIISDMAPNLSGNKIADQARSIALCELALDLAGKVLKPGGHLLVKTFQGEGFEELLQQFKESFAKVLIRKPKASRDSSREVYVLGKGFFINRKRL